MIDVALLASALSAAIVCLQGYRFWQMQRRHRRLPPTILDWTRDWPACLYPLSRHIICRHDTPSYLWINCSCLMWYATALDTKHNDDLMRASWLTHYIGVWWIEQSEQGGIDVGGAVELTVCPDPTSS